MHRHQCLLSLALVLGGALSAWAEVPQSPGPFNLLKLPSKFRNQRVSMREPMLPGKENLVAEFDGEGCLRHFWITTVGAETSPQLGLALVLRVYCDGEEVPHVETPLTPFFTMHHAHKPVAVDSPYIQVTDQGGYNCYFPMPYKKGIRITIENQGKRRVPIWFQADLHTYESGSLQEELRFRAAYRRVNRAQGYGLPYHVGHAHGRGLIVGMSLGMRLFDKRDRWYHCGGDLVLIDGGTTNAQVLSGIGGEDYFGNAWGQAKSSHGPIGTPYYDGSEDPEEAPQAEPYLDFAAYRFYNNDPIAFHKSFSFDFGSLENDISSVLYWYQDSKPKRFAKPTSLKDRQADTLVPADKYDLPEGGLVWDVAGPFSSKSRKEFESAEFPEHQIDYSETGDASFGLWASKENRRNNGPTESKWTRGVPSRHGFVDLTPHFRPRVARNGGLPYKASAYALTTLESEVEGEQTLIIGHDDALRIWVNGNLAYDGLPQKGFHSREVAVTLKQGKNQVLVKAANQANTNFRAWVFHLSVKE